MKQELEVRISNSCVCAKLQVFKASPHYFLLNLNVFASGKHCYLLYSLTVLGLRREEITMHQHSTKCIYKQQLPFPGAQKGKQI